MILTSGIRSSSGVDDPAHSRHLAAALIMSAPRAAHDDSCPRLVTRRHAASDNHANGDEVPPPPALAADASLSRPPVSVAPAAACIAVVVAWRAPLAMAAADSEPVIPPPSLCWGRSQHTRLATAAGRAATRHEPVRTSTRPRPLRSSRVPRCLRWRPSAASPGTVREYCCIVHVPSLHMHVPHL